MKSSVRRKKAVSGKGLRRSKGSERTNYIEVEAFVYDPATQTYGNRLVFDDFNGKRRSVDLPRSKFDEPNYLRRVLQDRGYMFPKDPTKRDQLISRLRDSVPNKLRKVVHQTGWQEDQFVLASGEVIGGDDEAIEFRPLNPELTTGFEVRGTVDSWKQAVAEPAAASSVLMFGILLALGAPLLTFTRVGNRAFHIVGRSSIGKTTALLVAQSVSRPARLKDLLSWNTTKAAFEEMAAANNDGLLCLDEIGHVSAAQAPSFIKDMAFTLHNGHIRRRSQVWQSRAGVIDTSLKFNVFTISTGESRLSQLSHDRMEGEQVRFIDVPALLDEELGVFETLPQGYMSSRAAIAGVAKGCAEHHGAVIRAWIKYLQSDWENLEKRIAKNMSKFYETTEVPNSAWEQRFAEPFALLYAAGLIAVRAGILPWRGRQIGNAVRHCYHNARNAVSSPDQQLADGIQRLERRLLSKKGIVSKKQFEAMSNAERREVEGFKLSNPEHGDYYAVTSEVFLSWFDSPDQAELVISLLDRTDQLIRFGGSYGRILVTVWVRRRLEAVA